MFTKVLVFLALTTIASGNDVIVGLKTDGNKFFDENRQANPALWRQMDNVTIKAPENEVIRRIVITDLRPEKDGDVKIVEGGEGQKNVTIELKSPTVLRGYEFHIELYSTPEENILFSNDQHSTTEIVQDSSSVTISTNTKTNSDTTSKLPDVSTDKIVPAVLFNDEVKDSERQGRNAKNDEDITSEVTTLSTSTAFNIGDSTTPITQHMEITTENLSEKSSDIPNKDQYASAIAAIPLHKNFNINPIIPAISGKEMANNSEEIRHVRDTEKDMPENSSQIELKINPTNVGYEASTKTDKEATTTKLSDAKPIEKKSENRNKEGDESIAPNTATFNNRKYTSIISTKVEHENRPIAAKNAEKLRSVRGANEEEKHEENLSTAASGESTTTDINAETSTLSSEDCLTTESANVNGPKNVDKDNNEGKTDQIPIYLNNRQWNQQFNNPTFQRDPDRKLYPAILANDQTITPETIDAEHIGNDSKSSSDNTENRYPKMNAIASRQIGI